MALTRRQREIYDFIREFVDGKGYSPSLEEIGAHFQLASVATVHKHIQHLVAKGYLRKAWNRSRSLEPVPESGGDLPEVPLLAVLPGTGGLTRITDKRKVRRDLADVFCTTAEGVRADRAKAWKLVDHIAPPDAFEDLIAERGAAFVSRGDDSGTNKRELELWRQSGRDPSPGSGTWYREVGAGMGAALNMAAAMNAYTLSDRATWLSFQNKRDLVVLVQNQAQLRNVYGITLVSKTRLPHVKAVLGQRFIDWMLSAAGNAAIAAYRIDGQQLFFPISKP